METAPRPSVGTIPRRRNYAYRRPDARVARVLFVLTLLAAAGLAGLLIAAPFLDPGDAAGGLYDRLRLLFAQDGVVRRTAMASAIGLAVTAWVFFRPGVRYQMPRLRKPKSPPNSMIGA